MNVLMNACQAVGESGRIEIATRSAHGKVAVTISDTGPGIAEEHIDHIFDPGFTTKGVGVGTGLGLSISFKIMERHNGTITATNRSGGVAAFTISLPAESDGGMEDTAGG
jgi:two-component system sensor histidine kinase HupT/HoxJ